ncbi:hypothetical protein THASP1DRAFT_21601 [Thamnocephalis sphaerospora]|uniref:Uncharacterized protein n=1 Tax=Thamnocephalis sphaerospora TaxID=78915 RepID=A0A4P9XZ49_9FUNG|nr:hypothetical protein THASP1DRAFT_21601 [Thamnocephalis sphaerospora]|eukprot:RKP10730.1 hypothetical protein THASP1DRAFT_21601 [Thamnocephalis sphaerospora]
MDGIVSSQRLRIGRLYEGQHAHAPHQAATAQHGCEAEMTDANTGTPSVHANVPTRTHLFACQHSAGRSTGRRCKSTHMHARHMRTVYCVMQMKRRHGAQTCILTPRSSIVADKPYSRHHVLMTMMLGYRNGIVHAGNGNIGVTLDVHADGIWAGRRANAQHCIMRRIGGVLALNISVAALVFGGPVPHRLVYTRQKDRRSMTLAKKVMDSLAPRAQTSRYY